MSGKALFFASDLHAGAPSRALSAEREKLFIRWLEISAAEAQAFYLLGDIWDFWFEYRHAVPKGYVRLLGALAALCDAGIPVFFQAGNHDGWLTDYLEAEVGLQRLSDPYWLEWRGLKLYLSHGHWRGPIPFWDRLTYALMENRFLTFLYRWLHPDVGLPLGRLFSARSRQAHLPLDDIDLGPKERLRQFVQRQQQGTQPADWYIFAHRHLLLAERIGRSQLIVLGDWIRRYSFLRMDDLGWGLFQFLPSGERLPQVVQLWADAPALAPKV